MSSPSINILSFLLIAQALFTKSPAAGEATPTAYEAMEEYNFPVGLLPKGVSSYELDPDTGKFKVYLNGSCQFYVQDYKLKYKSTISGVISKNELNHLKGISVKVLFLWLDISGVTRDDDEVYFSVGILSTSFGVDNFFESPECGCGFDCNGAAHKKNVTQSNLNRFVFSY